MSTNAGVTKLSAVVACYLDAPAIPQMHERLAAVFQKLGVDYEIIFVNDASPDDAGEVLRELAARDPRVTVINHTRNFGSQSAFTSGMELATGDAVVLLDGDLQDPPELIEAFVERWRQGYDVVYGVRVKRETSRLMQGAYKLFYRLFRAASYVQIPVDAGDFSLLDRRVVDALNSLPETNRFIRGLRAWVGFKQTGVTYLRAERPFGRSTNNLLRNLGWARKAIFSFSYAPLDFITVLAVTVCVISLILIVGQILARIFAPQLVPTGFTTLIVLILFIGGIQLLCLSIIGSYLAHLYDEVKRRPAFIRESVLNPPEARRAGQQEGEAVSSSETGVSAPSTVRPSGDEQPEGYAKEAHGS
ncbi:MAG: glycosyltransferase family 2 protein [Actinomycetota bacterium]|nr:glycosyltransferase family 2 protein [Actinomycetota bacterium]